MESLIQLKCLKAAAKRLGFSVKEFDEYGNLFTVETTRDRLHFANLATPFNQGSVEQICKDKGFTNQIVREVVRVPKSVNYFDPDFEREAYEKYKKFVNVAAIQKDIMGKFTLSVIVKMNSGTRGTNVFLCHSADEIKKALGKIFDKKSSDYDYAALAQEYVKPKAEYRAVLHENKIILLYKKDNSKAKFVGNLSPLHFEGARAVEIKDKKLAGEIENFLAPIFPVLPVRFAGFDLIRDSAGKFWLIEINARPGFSIFIRDNGEEPIVQMYEKILSKRSPLGVIPSY